MLKSLNQPGTGTALSSRTALLVSQDAVQNEFPSQVPELLGSSHACCKPPGATFRPEGRLDALKSVYRQENAALANKNSSAFSTQMESSTSDFISFFQNESSLVLRVSEEYPADNLMSNLIENNNKGFRHKAKLHEQFPNEDSLERFACMVYCDYNRRFSGKESRISRSISGVVGDVHGLIFQSTL